MLVSHQHAVAGGQVELAVGQQRVVVNVVENEWYATVKKRKTPGSQRQQVYYDRVMNGCKDLPGRRAVSPWGRNSYSPDPRYSSLPRAPHGARRLITAVGWAHERRPAPRADVRTCLDDRCAAAPRTQDVQGVDEQGFRRHGSQQFGYLNLPNWVTPAVVRQVKRYRTA